MGYNGKNRRFRSSMMSKSNYRKGSSMIFGKRGVLSAVFNAAHIVKKNNRQQRKYSLHDSYQGETNSLKYSCVEDLEGASLFGAVSFTILFFVCCFHGFSSSMLHSYRGGFLLIGFISLLFAILAYICYLKERKERINDENRTIARKNRKLELHKANLELLEANRDTVNTLLSTICQKYSFKKIDAQLKKE